MVPVGGAPVGFDPEVWASGGGDDPLDEVDRVQVLGIVKDSERR